MTYDEPEHGAELLKSIVPMMSRHAAGFHPISYALWYAYVKGDNALLRENVDSELKKRERLTIPVTYSLYARFVTEPVWKLLLGARSDLAEIVERVKHTIGKSGKGTAEFDLHLGEFLQQISHASSTQELESSVVAMQAETTRVRGDFGNLLTEVEESRAQVQRLTEQMKRLEAESITDALSGLLNRRGFERAMEEISKRNGDVTASLILLDIDRFKRINDTFGHPLGDRVIAAVGRAIHECVGHHGVAARYGGEEFAVLLPSKPIEIAEAMAESIRLRVQQGKICRCQGEDSIGSITISAGVAAWRGDEGNGTLLVERADQALYASKGGGRNRVTVAADRPKDG